jgi:hypothetical protein
MVVAAATDNSATYGTFVVSIAEQEKLMFNDKRYSIITSSIIRGNICCLDITQNKILASELMPVTASSPLI